MDKFRQLLFGSQYGLFIFYGLGWGVTTFAIGGDYSIHSIGIHLITATLFGLIMSTYTKRRMSYQISHLAGDSFLQMKSFRTLLKKNELPERSEYEAYEAFLQDRMKFYKSSSLPITIAAIILFGGFLEVSIVYIHSVIYAVVFGLFIVLGVIMHLYARTGRKKVSSLLKRMKI